MKTIEFIATVTSDGTVQIRLEDIPPGEYRAVLVLEDQPVTSPVQRPLLQFPVDDLGPWPEGLSLRREDMYGDGR
jgi:hypothetical protein